MDELKNKASKLSNMNKENPFGVPHDYFDDFNARLQVRIQQENEIKKPKSVIRYLKPALSLAASFIIIFMLVYWPLSKVTLNRTAEAENTTDSYSVESAILGVMEGMDDNTLLTLFENDSQEENFSDEELIAYLSTNMSDYDIYIESAQ